jgi:hypothetical protein
MDEVSSTLSKISGISLACQRIRRLQDDLEFLARDPHVTREDFLGAAEGWTIQLDREVSYIRNSLPRYDRNLKRIRKAIKTLTSRE